MPKLLHKPFGMLSQPLGYPAGGAKYASKIKTLFGSNLIGYYKMDEVSGTTAMDSSPQGNDGNYTGVDLADAALPGKIGGKAPLFDGANDYEDHLSAGLIADFDGDQGAIITWAKIYDSSVWTDGVTRYLGYYFLNGLNFVRITTLGNNNLSFRYNAGGTASSVNLSGVSHTDWFQTAITWDKPGDEVKAFENGSQVGSTQTGLGSWAGGDITRALIGAATAPASLVFHGWLAHHILLDRAAAPAEIQQTYDWGA